MCWITKMPRPTKAFFKVDNWAKCKIEALYISKLKIVFGVMSHERRI